MNHRTGLLGTTLVLGVLAGATILLSSSGGPGSADAEREAVPERPQLEAIQRTLEFPADEALPRIRVPELRPQPAPEPRGTGTELLVPPRPRPALAALETPASRAEPLPGIAVPELRRPTI